MIGRLTGKVAASDGDSAVVVDVGGVGYEVSVPLGTVGRSRADDAGRVTLFIHTHVREDQITLFGFASPEDRLTFRTLIGVSNVGPKTAIAVLGALPAGDLSRAIAAKDVARLQTIGGVGKKTAERLVLELRDKLPMFAGRRSVGPRARSPPRHRHRRAPPQRAREHELSPLRDRPRRRRPR